MERYLQLVKSLLRLYDIADRPHTLKAFLLISKSSQISKWQRMPWYVKERLVTILVAYIPPPNKNTVKN